MDVATVVGIVSGLSFICIAMTLGGGGLSTFLHIPSFMITVGGTVAATLINYPLHEIRGVLSTVRNAFKFELQTPATMIETLVSYATKARREGILTLESELESSKDPFLIQGVRLAIDGTAPELIKDILTTELSYVESRHSLGQGIFTMMGTYSPAFGMIGTLIGLISMLRALEDPSQIGQGMATALITTFYGALMANLIFLPIAGKLRTRTASEVLIKEVIIEGILSIQSGDNPRIVEEKLKAFVAPKLRENIRTSRTAAR
ncbi:MAG: motility protein A [Candidatus Hydrogenedentota bacterium]|nr:MAG: motility protein A [Candidatus Hydrogenedentota bacterium]